MADHSLVEAVSIWFSGKSLVGDTINGFSVLWIARGGKVLQLLGAALVIAELIGKERLVSWGGQLTNLGAAKKTWHWLKAVWTWLLGWMLPRKPDQPIDLESYRELRMTKEDIKKEPVSFVSALIGTSLFIIFVVYAFQNYYLWTAVGLVIPALFITGIFIGPLLTLALVALLAAIVHLPYWTFLRPMGALLSIQRLADGAKFLSFFLVVIGTILDMLGS